MGTGGRSDAERTFMTHVTRLLMSGLTVCLMAVAAVADEQPQA